MFCNRLLAAGSVVLLLTACGAKGPPKPPLSREPGAVRDLNVRQAGNAIELRWSRPRARANGDPIQGPMTFRVLARNLERTPVPSVGAGAPVPAPSPEQASGSTDARAKEDSFLKDSAVVAEITETPEQAAAAATPKGSKSAGSAKAESGGKPKEQKDAAEPAGAGAGAGPAATPRPPETQYAILLGPERFPGARFTSVRLAFAVVAQDASGRRSHARPILEIDPVEPPLPPSDLRATGTPEGVALTWRLPALPPSPPPPPTPAAPATAVPSTPAEMRGVDVYRFEIAPLAVPVAPGNAPAAPRFPYRPIGGSPFTGESALDRTALIGTSYLYEARLVTLAPGKGLRESASSGTVTVTYTDVFPPGRPTLVTALAAGAEAPRGVHVAWSAPIDAEVAGYRVYRAEGDGEFVLMGTVPAAQIEWRDTDVKPGTRYRYVVATIDAAVPPNESERSEEAEVTLPPEGS